MITMEGELPQSKRRDIGISSVVMIVTTCIITAQCVMAFRIGLSPWWDPKMKEFPGLITLSIGAVLFLAFWILFLVYLLRWWNFLTIAWCRVSEKEFVARTHWNEDITRSWDDLQAVTTQQLHRGLLSYLRNRLTSGGEISGYWLKFEQGWLWLNIHTTNAELIARCLESHVKARAEQT